MGRYIYMDRIWYGMDIGRYIGGYMSLYRVLYEQGPINCPLNLSFFALFSLVAGGATQPRARAKAWL